jgi:hypothetical protein
MAHNDYLTRLDCFAQELRPDAEHLDRDGNLLAEWYARFRMQGLHTGWSARHPLSGKEFCLALAALARVSGAFAFVALQQFVANVSLTSMAAEDAEWPATGVAFGHLRSPHGPAPRLEAGIAHGFVPWLTGAGIFPQVILGLRRADGQEVYTLVDATDRAAFRHSAPLSLAACSGSRTVSVQIEALRIEESAILKTQPAGTQARSDAVGVLYQTPLMVGCVQACQQLIFASPRIRPAEAESSRQATETLLNRVLQAFDTGTPEEGQRLRAELGDYTARLARLAVMASGGIGLLHSHPAQRLYREALVYSLMAQTDEIVRYAFQEVFP